jgi:hypothetical protein
MPLVITGFSVSNGMPFLLHGDMRPAERLFGVVPLYPLGPQIDQQQMAVGAARDQVEPAFGQRRPHRLGVGDHLLLIGAEFGPQRLAEGDRLGRDHMHQGPALDAGKDRRVELLRQRLVIGQDHPAARAAQRLVGGRGGHIDMREGRGVDARRDQPRIMGDIGQEPGADGIRDLAEPAKSSCRGIAEPPAIMSFGLCSAARAAIWS